ncbi:hypothetical protein [Micromonospora phytophila]|nr:hypothetical protein [Micromonospora phytophila]
MSVPLILLPLAVAAVTVAQSPLNGRDASAKVRMHCLQEERDVERG